MPYKTRTRKSPRNMRIFLEVPYNMTHMKLQIWIEIPVFTCVDRILVESNLLVCIGYPTCSNLVRLKTSILSHNILKSFFFVFEKSKIIFFFQFFFIIYFHVSGYKFSFWGYSNWILFWMNPSSRMISILSTWKCIEIHKMQENSSIWQKNIWQ